MTAVICVICNKSHDRCYLLKIANLNIGKNCASGSNIIYFEEPEPLSLYP